MKALFLEPNISKASPLITIAKAIDLVGASSSFMDPEKASTAELIKAYRRADVVVIQYYSKISDYTNKQLALATLLGVPVVRNWAGSDSLNAITKDMVKASTQNTNRLLSANITTTHQGIADELKSIGLNCTLLPQVLDAKIDTNKVSKHFGGRGILSYLPSSKREFYGANYLESLIKKHPDITFYIVADDEHYFAHYKNVKSLGWIEDLTDVWDDVGLLVRMTAHDGYPRMFLEAQARGKYIIHNNALPGVWLAKNQTELEHLVDKYLATKECNKEGIDIYNSLMSQEPEKKLFIHLSGLRVPFSAWVNSALYVFKYHVLNALGVNKV